LKKTRYTSRLIPIENSCIGKVNDIVDMAKNIIQDFCKPKGDPFTFSIITSIRNNDSIKKDDLITAIAALVPPENKVNLKTPDYCIVIEVINLVCGISILPDYYKLKRYNLEMLGEEITTQSKKILT
jgi:tRNA acetyltransferase TAN1